MQKAADSSVLICLLGWQKNLLTCYNKAEQLKNQHTKMKNIAIMAIPKNFSNNQIYRYERKQIQLCLNPLKPN